MFKKQQKSGLNKGLLLNALLCALISVIQDQVLTGMTFLQCISTCLVLDGTVEHQLGCNVVNIHSNVSVLKS